jgi:hypothetical protein
MSLTLLTPRTRATVGDTSRVEHPQRSIMFGTPFLRIECCPLGTSERAVRLGNKVLASQASHTRRTRPLWRSEGRFSRELIRRWHRYSLSLGKLGLTHRSRLPLLAEVLTDVPCPLRQDLPELLTVGRVRAPAITVLLPILIGEHRLEAPPMQVELHHIGGGKTKSREGRKEQFVDHPIAGCADRTGRGSGRMGGNNHPTVMSLCGHRQFSTIKEIPADTAFVMPELLISRQSETLLYLCEIKEFVIFAAHRPNDPSHPQIGDNGSVAIQPIESNEGLTWRKAL